jgi:hypothetical protein
MNAVLHSHTCQFLRVQPTCFRVWLHNHVWDVGEGIVSEPYRMYNLDVFEYESESPFGLYGSIPLVLAHRADLTVGAFWCAPLSCSPVVLWGPLLKVCSSAPLWQLTRSLTCLQNVLSASGTVGACIAR